MKKYAWIKQESDAETYLINNTYYKVVWSYSKGNDTGPHNQFDTDVCIFKWIGEPCTLDELPKAFENDWEPVEGFDLETIENSQGNLEVDWKDYAKKVDEILAQIEKEVKEMRKKELNKKETKEIKRALLQAKGKTLHVSDKDIIFTDTVPGDRCNNGGEYGFYTRYSPIPEHPGIYRVYTETTCDFDPCGTGYEGIHYLTVDDYKELRKASDEIEAAGNLYNKY